LYHTSDLYYIDKRNNFVAVNLLRRPQVFSFGLFWFVRGKRTTVIPLRILRLLPSRRPGTVAR
jgi:hypothetical protein